MTPRYLPDKRFHTRAAIKAAGRIADAIRRGKEPPADKELFSAMQTAAYMTATGHGEWAERLQTLRNAIGERHMGLVFFAVKWVMRRWPTADVDSLTSALNEKFARAIETYNPLLERFSTYWTMCATREGIRTAGQGIIHAQRFSATGEDFTRHLAPPVVEETDDVLNLRRVMKGNLAGLSETELFVIGTRYLRGMKLREIAMLIGVTKEWIRQMELSALSKLRAEMEKK